MEHCGDDNSSVTFARDGNAVEDIREAGWWVDVVERVLRNRQPPLPVC